MNIVHTSYRLWCIIILLLCTASLSAVIRDRCIFLISLLFVFFFFSRVILDTFNIVHDGIPYHDIMCTYTISFIYIQCIYYNNRSTISILLILNSTTIF